MKAKSFLFGIFLLAAFAFMINLATSPANGQATVKQTKTSVQQKSTKVQQFLNKLETAKSYEEVVSAFQSAGLSDAEKMQIQDALEQEKYRSLLDKLAGTGKSIGADVAAAQKRAEAVTLQKQTALATARSRNLSSINSQVMASFSSLHGSQSAASRYQTRSSNIITLDTNMTVALQSPFVGEDTGARILDLNPYLPRVGGALRIFGENFGTSRGAVDLIVERELVHCSISQWANRQIDITVSADAADLIGEEEREATLWVKLSGRNIGPTRKIVVKPNLASFTPHITNLGSGEITPGQRLLIAGQNFISTPGSATFEFNTHNFSMPATIVQWSDTALVISMPADLDGLRRQEIDIQITNRMGLSTSHGIRFIPEEQVITLSSWFDMGPEIVGLKHYEESFNFDLINDWTVEDSWIVKEKGKYGNGYEYNVKPTNGGTRCYTRIFYWVNAFGIIWAHNYITIKGPKGVPFANRGR